MVLGLTIVLSSYGQSVFMDQVRVENYSAVKENNSLIFKMDLVFNDMTIKSNEMLTLTPILISNKGTESKSLSTVVVNGGRRQKVVDRAVALNNPLPFETTPKAVLKRKNGTEQSIGYSITIPFEEWMKDASIKITEDVTGCAYCDVRSDELLLIARVYNEPYVPVYKLTYIVPEVEPVKARADKYTATLNFRVAKHDLDRSYMNNAAILAEADRIVGDIVNNKDLTVSDIEIVGYASPEASMAYNQALSERRANSFADYLSGKHNVPRNRMKVVGYGEDWTKTREVIEASYIADKDAILRIIDNVDNPDARDAELKKLSGGSTYKTMLNNYYPQVRRTEYTVSYNVRAFDVEEAKQIIRTNPKLLSLNEMYLVAQTYPADSKEFKEVFDIATRLYPDEPIAILNSAAADIEGGNNQAAVDRLKRIESDSRVWNNMGVAYARMGDMAKAKDYFNRAAAKGDADAKGNLDEIAKMEAGM
jgi:tetratricopeptide (TPR) repeat protein